MIKVCINCKKEFETKNKKQKYCSKSCGYLSPNRVIPNEIGVLENKVCIECKKVFKSSDNGKSFCSRRCKDRYWNIKRNKERKIIVEKTRIEKNKIKEQEIKQKIIKKIIKSLQRRLKAEQRIKDLTKVCKQCGEIFKAINMIQKYCCDECKRKHDNKSKEVNRRHKLKENGKIDYSISLKKVYKRDKGICAICGMLVDYDDYYIDEQGNFIAGNNYPSIDHIIPVSKGGEHIYKNVQLAHRLCNSCKNDKFKEV